MIIQAQETTILNRKMRWLVAGIALVLPATISAQAQTLPYRVVQSGKTLKIVFIGSIEPDCRSRGKSSVSLLAGPTNGEITTREAMDFPVLSQNQPAFSCERRRVPGTQLFYKSNPGFVGFDQFMIEIVFPDGVASRFRYVVQVR